MGVCHRIIDFNQSCPAGAIKRSIQGTPDFMAPEQARGQRIHPHADIFNLGATLYWYLVERPIPTESPEASARVGRRGGDYAPPDTERDDLPPGLSKLVMDCVQPEPRCRPASMQEVYERLLMIEKLMQV